ncbi:MAG TPA: hypothetical protein ENI73_00740 [Spirochaetes bacterium]|nr:hypothetical protein [Spirochaetota bacterium]
MKLFSFRFDLIRERVVRYLEDRLIPMMGTKINNKLEDIRQILIKRYGMEKKEMINDYIKACKEELYQEVGPEYVQKFVQDEADRAIRMLTSAFENPKKPVDEDDNPFDFDESASDLFIYTHPLPIVQDFTQTSICKN